MTATPPPPLLLPPEPRFLRLWRLLVPLAVAIAAAALVLGVFDTSARPAWLFGLGIAVGVVGAASLIGHVVLAGRRRFAALERQMKDEFESHGGRGA